MYDVENRRVSVMTIGKTTFFTMTSSNGNISALLAFCVGNSPVTGEFLAQRPVTRSFDVFVDLRLNKRMDKQWWGWWLDTPSRRLWRNCNGYRLFNCCKAISWCMIWYHGYLSWSGCLAPVRCLPSVQPSTSMILKCIERYIIWFCCVVLCFVLFLFILPFLMYLLDCRIV